MSRYNSKEKVINRNDLYSQQFENRDVHSIVQYRMDPMTHPTAQEEKTLSIQHHRWQPNDRLYRLADQHYGDFRLWWLIAQYNRVGSELELSHGQIILIPHPLSLALQYVV